MLRGSLSSRRPSGVLAVALVAMLLAACQAAQPTPPPATPTPPTATSTPAAATATPVTPTPTPQAQPDDVNIHVAFRWPLSNQYSVFLVGMSAGIYERHGLNVTWTEGSGSANASQIVGAGQADYAVAVDAGSAMRAISQGADLQILAETLPAVTMAVLSRGDNCIESPQDLAGKRIAVPPGTAQSQIFPAFLRVNDIDPTSFEEISADAATLVSGLLTDQFDGYVSYTVSNFPILTREGADPCAMLFYDWGVSLSPGETVIGSRAALDNTELTSRVVAAIVESIEYAVDNREEACQTGVEMFPDAMTMEICIQAVNLVSDQIQAAMTASTEPFACINDEQIDSTLDLLEEFAEFEGRQPANTYYINEFVPGDC